MADPGVRLDRPPPLLVIKMCQNYIRSKNPEGPRIFYCKASDYSVFSSEITMARVNLSEMSVEALMDLRKRVDEMLLRRRAELEKQLERIAVVGGVGRGGGSALKGRKVPPKYRGPSGETWAGRGAKPRWLVAAKGARNSTIF